MTAAAVLDAFRARGWMLATAESCTGGMVAAALTDIAGSSDVVDRGFVTYSNAAKMDMLGVRAVTLEAHGAVSPQVAAEMAEGALMHANVQVAVAITGIAGPGGSEHKPEGRVWFALARNRAATQTLCREFGAIGRSEVRQAATATALELLLESAEN